MKTKFILAASISALSVDQVSAISIKDRQQQKLTISHKFAQGFSNRDNEDGADEYDRLEEANENSLEYNDILQYSENVKEGKISEKEQVKVLDKAEELEKEQQDKNKRAIISEQKVIMTNKPTAAFIAKTEQKPTASAQPAVEVQPLQTKTEEKPKEQKATVIQVPVPAQKQSLVQAPTVKVDTPTILAAPAATPVPKQVAAPVQAPEKSAPAKIEVKKGVSVISLKKIETKTLSTKNTNNSTSASPPVKPVEKAVKPEEKSATPVKPIESPVQQPKTKVPAEVKKVEAPKVAIAPTAKVPVAAKPAQVAAPAAQVKALPVSAPVKVEPAPAKAVPIAAKAVPSPAPITESKAPEKAAEPKKETEKPKAQNLGAKKSSAKKAKKMSSSEMKDKLHMKKTKQTVDSDDSYDWYNQVLPTSDNDIYNIGDATQQQINKSLIKQQNLIAQNEILEEDQKLAEVIQESSVDQIDKGVDLHSYNGINFDSLIDQSTSEFIKSQNDLPFLLNKPKSNHAK